MLLMFANVFLLIPSRFQVSCLHAVAALVIRYCHRRLLCYFACMAKIFHVCLDGMGPEKTITLSIILVDGRENWLALYLALPLQ